MLRRNLLLPTAASRADSLGRLAHPTAGPLLLGSAFFVLYLLTGADTVQAYDSGELVAAAVHWGIPHPPGFPTYMLLGGFAVRVVPGSAAWGLTCLSALAGAVAIGLFAATARAFGVRAGAALAVAAGWGLLAPTWALHTSQEVLGVAHAFAAAILFLSVRTAQRPTRALWLGVVSGLGVGVHPTVVLCAPLAVWAVMPGLAQPRTSFRPLLASAGGVLLGLASWAYLPWAAAYGGLPRWGLWNGVGDLWAHAVRADYGTFDLALGPRGSAWGTLLRLEEHLLIHGVGLLVAIVAGAALLWRGSERGAWRAVIATVVLAGIVFPARFRAPDTAWWAEITSRFFPLCSLAACLLAAGAVDLAMARWPSRPLVWRVVAVVWLLAIAVVAVPEGPSRGRDLVAGYADDLLASLPEGAWLVGQSDLDGNAIWEAQLVRDQRPDVVFVMAKLLPAAWYAAQVKEKIGYEHPVGKAGLRLLFEHAQTQGRRVFLTQAVPEGLAGRWVGVPRGLAIEILPAGTRVPPPAEVERGLAFFYGDRALAPSVSVLQSLRATDAVVIGRYVAPWGGLEQLYTRLGDPAGAARCRAIREALETSRKD